mmetsp:Transcript_9108/g.13172  ORF Transcript_9108/g.13172 Transcript_9108/m.13172 type:complete len:196 (-) Transcript_9108:711-1298(-)
MIGVHHIMSPKNVFLSISFDCRRSCIGLFLRNRDIEYAATMSMNNPPTSIAATTHVYITSSSLLRTFTYSCIDGGRFCGTKVETGVGRTFHVSKSETSALVTEGYGVAYEVGEIALDIGAVVLSTIGALVDKIGIYSDGCSIVVEDERPTFVVWGVGDTVPKKGIYFEGTLVVGILGGPLFIVRNVGDNVARSGI